MHHHLIHGTELSTLTIHELRELEWQIMHILASHALRDIEYRQLAQIIMAIRHELMRRCSNRLRPL